MHARPHRGSSVCRHWPAGASPLTRCNRSPHLQGVAARVTHPGSCVARRPAPMKPAIHTNCDVVIVPPMEAVWLTGPAFTLHDGRGCLSFEVKGEGRTLAALYC